MTQNVVKITGSDTPWEISCKLINAKTFLGEGIIKPMFEMAEIKRIGEHLVYYATVEESKNGK